MLEAHGVQCLLVQHLAGAKQTILTAFLLGKLLSPKNLCWALGLNGWETHLLLSIPMATCTKNLKKRGRWRKVSIPPTYFSQNIFYLQTFPVKCNLIKLTKQGCFDPCNGVVIRFKASGFSICDYFCFSRKTDFQSISCESPGTIAD